MDVGCQLHPRYPLDRTLGGFSAVLDVVVKKIENLR
jgi:hypothetical protein